MAGYKGKQGRKRKPDALKVLQGTFRKDRSNPNQPKPTHGIPKFDPKLLSKNAQKHYKRIAQILDKMKILTEADVFALEILAQALADYYDAKEKIELEGKTIDYINHRGDRVIKVNPLVSIMNESRRTVINLLSRFGLEPSARASLNIAPEVDDDRENKWKEF